jgi:uncharacterized protein YhaN
VQSAELRLPAWGRIKVRSGATELEELREKLAEDHASLRDDLLEIGVASVADAEQVLSRRKDLEKDIRAAEENLQTLLGNFESLKELETHADQLAVRVHALLQSLAPTTPELTKSLTDLDTESEVLKALVKAQQAAQTDASGELKRRRKALEQKSEARQKVGEERTKLAARISSLELQTGLLLDRYSQGIEKGKADAQGAFVRAEARRNQARDQLPADCERLPERSRRATQAAAETRADVERHRNEQHRLEGALQQAGAEGLHSKEGRLIERKESLQTKLDALRARGWAARLARDLIDLRQQAATRSVLAPLENRLSAAFADVTGIQGRRVFLNDELEIVGVGDTREAAVQFPYLSQGAKEQLLLCLRLAVATEVSSLGQNLVILDDVLVNTDSQRQERVLDVLRASAEQMQILIITGHPERYRGVGAIVEIQAS